MLNIKTIVIVSTISLLSCSCSTISVHPTGTIQVSCDNDIPCTSDSTLYEFSGIFSFHSDDTDGIVNRIGRMLFCNHRIYVADRVANKVMMYDENGTFLGSTSKYIGRASNEYIRLIDATTDGQYIYVSCDAPYQILKFDADLNILGCTKIDMYLNEIVTDGKYLYGIRPCGENSQANELVAYRLDALHDAPVSVLPPTRSVRGRMIMGKSLACAEGKVYVNLPFDTGLYVIADGKVKEHYELDFGEYGLLSNPIPQGVSLEDFDVSHEKTVWGIVNLNVSDSVFLFNTNLGHTHIVGRSDMSIGGCMAILNDDFPISTSGIVPCVGQDHEIRFLLNDMVVNLLLREYDKNVRRIPVLEEIKRRYEQDGGPLVVVWKIR